MAKSRQNNPSYGWVCRVCGFPILSRMKSDLSIGLRIHKEQGCGLAKVTKSISCRPALIGDVYEKEMLKQRAKANGTRTV